MSQDSTGVGGVAREDREADEEKIRVVAAVIERGGRVLVCRRPPCKRHADKWEFPGGKVHDGESDADAVRRELDEELAVGVRVSGAPLLSVDDPGSAYRIVFVPTEIEGEPRAIEHAELRWCEPSELPRLDLAPSDARFVEARFGARAEPAGGAGGAEGARGADLADQERP